MAEREDGGGEGSGKVSAFVGLHGPAVVRFVLV
jgi:hypothetical protein